jgi:ferrous iron transport protein B
VAVTGEGIKEVAEALSDIDAPGTRAPLSDEAKWAFIGEMTKKVQTIEHKHPSLLEKLENASVNPLTGTPIALAVILVSFLIIRTMGEGLISLIEPMFENYYQPFITKAVESIFPSGLLHDLLIGTTPDLVESFGVLTTGLFVPLAMVLPYVFSFYVILGILEDVGYLPRLAVLADTLMHRLGLHGSSIIPLVLGMGCNVPGVLATRILETRRERFIAITLMAVTVPCMAQNAVIIGLVGSYGLIYLGVVYGTLFTVFVIIGHFLNKILKGVSPELFLEIPDYHIPNVNVLLKKTWMRMRGFLIEAIPFVLLGVFIVNILYIAGVIEFLATICAPVLERVLGLPQDAIVALLIGFLRKDMAIGMLEPLHLLPQQLVVASVVLTLYFPCIATFAVLLRELGVKDTARAVGIMMVTALAVGGVLRFLLEWVM